MDNKSWVQISGALIPVRTGEDVGEVSPVGSLSWRSYYPGFPSRHLELGEEEAGTSFFSKLVRRGGLCIVRALTLLRSRVFIPASTELFEPSFFRAKDSEWADWDRKKAQSDGLRSQ